MASSFKIGGPSPQPLNTLDSLGLPNPHPVKFKPYDRVYRDGQGVPRADGFASASWHFDALTHGQLQTLLDLIGDKPGDEVRVTTRTDRGADYAATFVTFEGMMHRPEFGEDYDIEMGRTVYTNLVFEFTSLVEEEV